MIAEKCRLSFSFSFQGHLQPGGGGSTVEAIIGPDGAQAFQEVCPVFSEAVCEYYCLFTSCCHTSQLL